MKVTDIYEDGFEITLENSFERSLLRKMGDNNIFCRCGIKGSSTFRIVEEVESVVLMEGESVNTTKDMHPEINIEDDKDGETEEE